MLLLSVLKAFIDEFREPIGRFRDITEVVAGHKGWGRSAGYSTSGTVDAIDVLRFPHVALFICCGLVSADSCEGIFGLSEEVKDVQGEEVRSGTVAGSIFSSACIVQLNLGWPGSCAIDGLGCGISGRREESARDLRDSTLVAVATGVNCLRRSATPMLTRAVEFLLKRTTRVRYYFAE